MSRPARRYERGVTMVEFALVFTLLLMIAIGAFEYGMVFRDSLTVATSAREAGRVAASTADHGEGDCVILEAAAGVLQALDTGILDRVHIYKSDETGTYPPPGGISYLRSYSPRQIGDTEVPLNCDSSTWSTKTSGPNWDPEDRVNEEGAADWIGVRVDYEHSWITNFLWWNGSIDLADDAVFRIEPPAPA